MMLSSVELIHPVTQQRHTVHCLALKDRILLCGINCNLHAAQEVVQQLRYVLLCCQYRELSDHPGIIIILARAIDGYNY